MEVASYNVSLTMLCFTHSWNVLLMNCFWKVIIEASKKSIAHDYCCHEHASHVVENAVRSSSRDMKL
eukprot:4316291-Karenia_brevis.AAC.1